MNKLLVSLTASLALLAAAPAMAQQNQQEPAAQQTQSSGYSDPAAARTQATHCGGGQLKYVIGAQEGVMEVREVYIQKIQAADSQQKAQELQMEANDKMVSVFADVGFDISSFHVIATAYSSEPKVRNRVV